MIIKLNVIKIGETALPTATDMLFNTDKMDKIRANGSNTQFEYFNDRYLVTESFSAMQTSLGVTGINNSTLKAIWGLFDATGGKSIGSHDLVDPVTLEPIKVPQNAVIIDGFANIETTFTSATDAATIALGIHTDSAAGLKAAIAISNGANPWDAGKTALIPVGTAATALVGVTADRKVQAVVAAEALTAGKMKVLIIYSVKP